MNVTTTVITVFLAVVTLLTGAGTYINTRRTTDLNVRSTETSTMVTGLDAAFNNVNTLYTDCEQRCRMMARNLVAAEARIIELEKHVANCPYTSSA